MLRVVCETTRGENRTREVRYYVTSLSRDKSDVKRLLEIVRRHWGTIENGLHGVRDAVFREDRSTISLGNTPQNLAALLNAAIACLRASGAESIAATLRSFHRKPQRLFAMLGLCKQRKPGGTSEEVFNACRLFCGFRFVLKSAQFNTRGRNTRATESKWASYRYWPPFGRRYHAAPGLIRTPGFMF